MMRGVNWPDFTASAIIGAVFGGFVAVAGGPLWGAVATALLAYLIVSRP